MSPQFVLLAVRVGILLTGCLAATWTFAQAPAPKTLQSKSITFKEPLEPVEPIELAEADAKADAETLVVGDWYKLRVKRRGVSAHFEGGLVKINDQWIVLRIVSEGRTEFGVPVVSKIPFAGRLFKNVGIGRTDDMLWIPREAATVEQRTKFAQQAAATDGVVPVAAKENVAIQAPAGDEPPAGRACTLQFALARSGAGQAEEGQKVEERDSGDLIEVTDDAVSLMVTRNVSESASVPLVGELPIIGRAFTRERTVIRKERRQIDRADLLSLRVSNHQLATASVELVPMPSEPAAPIAPSPPLAPLPPFPR
jgi:hypothetical protein